MKTTIELCAAALAAAALAGPVAAQTMSRASVATDGSQGDGRSFEVSISADGRYVVFASQASNLVVGDTNGVQDIFVRDRRAGTTERVSVDSNGTQGNGGSSSPSISGDGRYVAFASSADNLVTGDTNGTGDIFVRDRLSGTTIRASVDSFGHQTAEEGGRYPSISQDGRYVGFWSYSSELVPGDTNGEWDVFIHDIQSGVTTRVSVDSNGVQGNGQSAYVSLSRDGRYVTFQSVADNLVPADTNHAGDVFLHDMLTGRTTRVSVDSNGMQANGYSGGPAIGSDGRFVAFSSGATNLAAGATNQFTKVFLHDMQSGATTLVSANSAGVQCNQDSGMGVVSSDGGYVAFESRADSLVPGDTNACTDVFVRDCVNGVTTRVSVNRYAEQGDARSGMDVYGSTCVSMSMDARYVAFGAEATNLVPGDTNGFTDVFVHERAAIGFASRCDPGVIGGALECPCSNPPANAGRGCDNSSVTGGAVLAATGTASLAQDSLVFTTSGEKPSALSIVLQGNAGIASGVVYGQGVRCVGGTIIRRLFVKHASGGSITAPESGTGDPTVSASSAARGDPIQAGQTRWYLVYYRDPIVLDLCSPTSTFNATQTGEVDWSM